MTVFNVRRMLPVVVEQHVPAVPVGLEISVQGIPENATNSVRPAMVQTMLTVSH